MAKANLYISLESLGTLLQLPSYLDIIGICIDPVMGRLEIAVDSDAIPEGTREIRPAYMDEEVESYGENTARFRRLVGIELIPTEAFTT